MFSQIFGRSNTPGESSIAWHNLTNVAQIDDIIEQSKNQPILIFKHSVSCGTSAMALDRLQRNWITDEMSILKSYFLNLIAHRDVSNKVSETFGVWHQSPQVLIIYKGACVHDNSHMGISYQEIKSILSNLGTV